MHTTDNRNVDLESMMLQVKQDCWDLAVSFSVNFLNAVRLDYYAEHQEEFIEEYIKHMEEEKEKLL